MLKNTSLHITFHNPNTVDEVVKELIKISAELAKSQISDRLLHRDSVNSEEEAGGL